MIRHLCFAVATAVSASASATPTPELASTWDTTADSALYRVLLIRAAPGRLLELIEVYKHRVAAYEAETSERPYLFRHSQGDQWDLMLLVSLGESTSYTVAGSVDGLSPPADGLVAWREELLASGPESAVVHGMLEGAGFLHVEMFVALPGRRGDLLEQRRMENDFLGSIRRPRNLIFTRAGGASWDLFTLGAYRDLQHFAEPAGVSDDEQERAAVAAGFEGADRIGSYLRTLIAHHHDTLAVMVR